ncbi:MAG: protein kinase [Deltaproteobacteria bacterium]|nr:protein kinase [Deltaproteobacteria bacterium]
MSSRPDADSSSIPQPGELVAGRYEVERVLGAGGMGVVLAARDRESGEPIALKLLQRVSDTKAIDRFFREARTMGQLASEHVVRVRDVGVADDRTPYLVMERLEGEDLSQRARRGPLPLEEAADVLIQACEALSHAHAKGVVHRDVKPSNLFLHRSGNATIVKILDFGISKVQARDLWEHTLTGTADGGVLGSPPYMSPEQVRDPRTVDARSDVWSLGVLLFRLLSGAVPFHGESVGEVFAKILERPAPSIRLTTDVPPAVDAIIARCLVKDRDGRCAHVGELALALAPFASKEIAALAPAIMARAVDEMPTFDRGAPEPVAPDRRAPDEPRTLTVSGPPKAAASMPAPEVAAQLPAIPRPPSLPREMAVSSTTPSPIATGGELSVDVASPRRSRAWLAVLLAVGGIAGGLAIGLSRDASTATPRAATSLPEASASPRASNAPVASAPPPEASNASAVATSSVASAAPAPLPVASGAHPAAPGKRGSGGRKAGPGATTPQGPGAAAGGSTSKATPPELQPSPYPTP